MIDSPRPDGDDIAYGVIDLPPWRRKLSVVIVRALIRGQRVIARNWLSLLTGANILLFGGTILAPFLASMGWDSLSSPVYAVYKLLCLQRPSHSFFLFGYQMSMEVRMVAIAAGYSIAGIAFGLSHRRMWQPLTSLSAFGLLSLPMFGDIFSQSFGWRDSNAFWRGATGLIFGLATIWYFYPHFTRAMAKDQARFGKVSADAL